MIVAFWDKSKRAAERAEHSRFKIDKDLIIVQDTAEAIADLDKKFATLDKKEKDKDGKK